MPQSVTMFPGKVDYFVQDDGGIAFHRPGDTDTRWVCYTKYPVSGFIPQIMLLLDGGWKTPWDAQEIACRKGLASYSK